MSLRTPHVLRSILLFVLAALAEIGGAWLVWQGIRERRGLAFVGAGILALGLYGCVAPSNPTLISAASWPPTAACSWPAG
jgi:drug/metabolite transporter superfamily protein YnfA